MKEECGCCEGIEKLTPLPTANRPGLNALGYRVGTHATFLETMLARLSTHYLEIPLDELDEHGKPTTTSVYPFQRLTTRLREDPAIALLDAWATVADVLTFYQERIANEGYLRTATERRSILELARLVGYRLRPGVASSVYLAYTLDENSKDEVVILNGARSQSVPGPGELPQSFETNEDLKARAAWDNLKPTMARPQNITLHSVQRINRIYFAGTTTNLKPNDPLLLVFGSDIGDRIVRTVQEVNPVPEQDRTHVTLQETPFLVIAAVDVFRITIAALNQRLKNAQASEPSSIWFEGLRDGLGIVFENLSLGNYPPLHTVYFSHDRIYRFLKSPARTTAPQFLSAFRGRVGAVTEITAPAWKDPQVIAFTADVLDQAISMLKNTTFQHDLLCLVRHVLRQTQPTSLEERIALRSLLELIPSIKSLLDALRKQEGDVPEELRLKVFDLLRELILFLQDPELRQHFDALLEELLALAAGNDFEAHRTFLLETQEWLKSISVNATSAQCEPAAPAVTTLSQLTGPLLVPPSLQPANSTRLVGNIRLAFGKNADAIPQLLTAFQPRLDTTLYQAWANARVETAPPQLKSVHALRLTAPLFGHNAQVKMGLKRNTDPQTKEIPFISVPDGDWEPADAGDESPGRVYLDNAYDGVLAGAYVVIHNGKKMIVTAARAETVMIRPRTAYGISVKTTQIDLSREWWEGSKDSMDSVRKTVIWVETEVLALAQEPYQEDVAGDTIELEDLYDGLIGGRWVIVAGERSDIPGTSGVRASELAMLSAVDQVFNKDLPGDKTHSVIKVAAKLAYIYKRDTVTIYGNVVKATHGETRKEVLGSGDGAKALQSFTLKQPPLTFVSAPNPSGVDSTLKVFVNDIKWYEADGLAGLAPPDRNFITKIDDESKTTVIFGNGKEGARLPTGVENIKSEYRNGIGKPGNVKAGQISLLVTRPLGVKEVINPLRASGGADKENRDQARKNAPLAVKALDRLVSVQDYADFARTSAGVGKARAEELSDGRRQLVHVTIAGADDIPIDETSELFQNLREALHDFGDPFQPIQLAVRELMLLVISARVRILLDYQWEPVVTELRAALLDAFSFERRELGQDVLLSEVIGVMQGARGVDHVDVDVFGGVPEKTVEAGERRLLTPEEISAEVQKLVAKERPESRLPVNLAALKNSMIRPAQLAFLTPDVPATLILNQIT